MVDEPVSELTEVGAELVEPAFDRLLTSEVLKEVPVLGSAVKVARAVGAIRDRIFAAKIARFLTELGKVDEPEATEMLWQLRKDPEFRDRVGSTLLVVLDRIDELDKAAMVAKAFRAYLHKRIELATFRRMCLVITSAFLDDLGEFVGLEVPADAPRALQQSLLPMGLFESSRMGVDLGGFPSIHVSVTDLGQAFHSIMRQF